MIEQGKVLKMAHDSSRVNRFDSNTTDLFVVWRMKKVGGGNFQLDPDCQEKWKEGPVFKRVMVKLSFQEEREEICFDKMIEKLSCLDLVLHLYGDPSSGAFHDTKLDSFSRGDHSNKIGFNTQLSSLAWWIRTVHQMPQKLQKEGLQRKEIQVCGCLWHWFWLWRCLPKWEMRSPRSKSNVIVHMEVQYSQKIPPTFPPEGP